MDVNEHTNFGDAPGVYNNDAFGDMATVNGANQNRTRFERHPNDSGDSIGMYNYYAHGFGAVGGGDGIQNGIGNRFGAQSGMHPSRRNDGNMSNFYNARRNPGEYQRQQSNFIPRIRLNIARSQRQREQENNPGYNLPEQQWDNIAAFNKNVYQPNPTLLALPEETITAFRCEMQITASGQDLPYPIRSFVESTLPESVIEEMKRQGFTKPTALQAQSWPVALSGRDLVGIAPTATGKTLAYLLPAMVHIVNQTPLARCDGPIAIVLVPTRELAQQIHSVASNFGRLFEPEVRSACIFGGTCKATQARDLGFGVEMIIATPGRLIDFLRNRITDLRRCSFLVIDEATRLFDEGLEQQVRVIVKQIRPDRQVVMCSTTWPREVHNLALQFLNEYIFINIGSMYLSLNHNIQQHIVICHEDEKPSHIVQLLREVAPNASHLANNLMKIIIFVNTKLKAEELLQILRRKRYAVESIHGSKYQSVREKILQDFREREFTILIATDVAASGLDIKGVQYVINYDYPELAENYIHRVGRTAHSQPLGAAITFFTHNNANEAAALISVLEEAGQVPPQGLVEMAFFFNAITNNPLDYITDAYTETSDAHGYDNNEGSYNNGDGEIMPITADHREPNVNIEGNCNNRILSAQSENEESERQHILRPSELSQNADNNGGVEQQPNQPMINPLEYPIGIYVPYGNFVGDASGMLIPTNAYVAQYGHPYYGGVEFHYQYVAAANSSPDTSTSSMSTTSTTLSITYDDAASNAEMLE